MPSLRNNRERVDALVDAAVHLVETHGVEALTLRRLASTLRLSPSTLVFHLDNKQRVLDLITKFVGADVVQSVERESIGCGLDAAVPDDEQVRTVRAWLALSELARGDADRDAAVTRVQAELRHVLGWLAQLPPDDDLGRDVLLAVTSGLWVARCSRTDPMSVDAARAVLRHACEALGVRPAAGAA